MLYLAEHGVQELWGDISQSQVNTATKLLSKNGFQATMIKSSMENDPGIPHNYFDVVFSIYALGWTLNLREILRNVSNYLKNDRISDFANPRDVMEKYLLIINILKRKYRRRNYEIYLFIICSGRY